MTRVLALGHVPLPFENLKKSYAPGARAWQMCLPLVEDGHDVLLIGSRIPFVYPEHAAAVAGKEESGCRILSVKPEVAESPGFVRDAAEEFGAECMLGICAYPSYLAAISGLDLPFWADLFGSQLAEAQLKAAVYDDDALLEHFHRMNHAVLSRADRFSTVALRQKYELIGELALLGRLTSATTGYDFVHEIPAAFGDARFDEEGARLLREKRPDDFLVLWSGGYNTWTDTATLFQGLSYAMDRDPRILFVSTGGSIDGHDERTYPSLVEMVAGSRHRERFILEGWIDRQTARSYYLACDVGINIDARTYEVMLGSRTRLLDWALAGLPAVSTDLCELTGELAAEGLLFTFEPGNPESLGERLLELSRCGEKLRETGERLKEYVMRRFSSSASTGPLREWAAAPDRSPDWEQRKERVLASTSPLPAITPESTAGAKLIYYLKNEGPLATVRRAVSYSKRSNSRR